MSPVRFLRNSLRKRLSNLGYEIYRRPFLPKGADAFDCIRSHWPDWRPAMILDVGANVGQSYDRLRPVFSTARILCFEPVPSAFVSLRHRIAADPLAEAHQLALSDKAGVAWIHAHLSSDRASMTPDLVQLGAVEERIEIPTDTLAAVCARQRISSIDLLKIDVEGHELSVLNGAAPLLSSQSIEFLVIEAGLIEGNPRFTPLPTLNNLLIRHGYWLIGVCEQYGARYSQGAEFCNAVFCRQARLE